MIVFLIPVRHEASVPDYDKTWKLLNNTLVSISRQNCSNWHVVVCANKVQPVQSGLPMNKITFIEYKRTFVGRSLQQWSTFEFRQHLIDKAIRRKCGVKWARQQLHPQWYFMADADDYVSNDLVSTILSTVEYHHMMVTVDRGLILSLKDKCYVETNQFNDICGTSVAFRANLIHHNLDKDAETALLSQHRFHQFEDSFAYHQRHSLVDKPHAAYLQHDDNHGRKIWAHTKLLQEAEPSPLTSEVRERFGILKVMG